MAFTLRPIWNGHYTGGSTKLFMLSQEFINFW